MGLRKSHAMTELLAKTLRGLAVVAAVSLVLLSCSEQPAPFERSSSETPDSAVSFVNRVWRVSNSSSVAPGTLYVFLSEGTLVITSPNSKPALGSWKYEGSALTMVEEGIPYNVDILKLSKDGFRIRSNNPGKPVEITLVPAGVHILTYLDKDQRVAERGTVKTLPSQQLEQLWAEHLKGEFETKDVEAFGHDGERRLRQPYAGKYGGPRQRSVANLLPG